MKIITEGVELVIELLDEYYLDEKKFNKYINSRQGKIFLNHEMDLNRETNVSIVKREMIKVISDEKHEDSYEFYILKKNLQKAKNDIKYIKENEEIIIQNVLLQVYKYVPKYIKVKPNIVLYAGGVDGGFATFTKDVYINFIKYIGNISEFEKILAHEFFHARKIPINKKIILFLKMSFSSERAMFDSLGRILEEGIACLVQHGIDFVVDDPIGTLTSREIVLCKEHFELLNKVLLSIKNKKPNYKLIYKLNVYILGYIISKTIYENGDIFVLDEWTVRFNYKKPIKRYIEICRDIGKTSGFNYEVEKWLLNM